MSKIAIVGTRDFNDYEYFKKKLNELDIFDKDTIIVSGGARGPDMFAELYTTEMKYHLIVFPAKWNTYGKQAGFLRNTQIVNECDIVIAFWDGKSKGTEDTIKKARMKSKPVIIINYNDQSSSSS